MRWEVYDKEHLKRFKPHETVRTSVLDMVENGDKQIAKALVKGDEVRAVVYFRNIEHKDWIGAIFISEDFNARDGFYTRKYIREGVVGVYRPLSVLAISKNEKYIDRWHEFLEMEEVGLTKSEDTGELVKVWSTPRWVLKQLYF